MNIPELCHLDWDEQYRIIPSRFPPINIFEGLVDPELTETLFEIEAMTNDRLRDEVGEIHLVSEEDRIIAPGATPVMAAFTHIGLPSRFSSGDYGVYYAAKTLNTAIEETRHNREKFLRATSEAPGDIDMRVYVGTVVKPMHDIRPGEYAIYHDPDDWKPSQTFGRTMRSSNSWGLVYRSVREPGGECIAAFRPPAVSIPKQGKHLAYVWDGKNITHVYEKTSLC